MVVSKRLDFDEDDFRPFVIQSECEAPGYRKRWPLSINLVNKAARHALLYTHEMPYSKSDAFHTALEALGWKRCGNPFAGQESK